jgi:hypothetical protein
MGLKWSTPVQAKAGKNKRFDGKAAISGAVAFAANHRKSVQ